jgi:arylsulfatase A-like enzyme
MAMCSNLDDNVGRLLKKLDEKGIRDNTLVVYTSDHGDLLGSHGIHDWHKSRPEHVSCRVPLNLHWPGALSPRVSDMLVGTLDLMPTLLGLLGVRLPGTCQGSDHSGSLRKGEDAATESVPLFFWGEGSDWRGVYTQRYTYAFEPPGATRGIEVLYDRQEDPDELNNLFESPDHRDVRERLYALTRQWLVRFGDGHVPWDRVKHHLYVDSAAAEARWEPMHVESAALKGRPVDLISGEGEKHEWRP